MAHNFSGEYWIVSVPKDGQTEESVYAKQAQRLSRFCEVHPFDMPSLRVSAVDELMNLSESLMKYDVFGRSVLMKIVRSYREYLDQPEAMPTVRERQLHNHIPEFEWERGRVPPLTKLPELANDIQERLATTSDRLKSMIEKYKQIRAKLNADERAQEGNLMVCDLQNYVKATDYIDGEFITTSMVIVPSNRQAEFEDMYWRLDSTDEAQSQWRREMTQRQKLLEQGMTEDELADYESPNWRSAEMPEEVCESLQVVVPDSAELLHGDVDFCLYRVVLLKTGVEWFKNICREFRYTVRDFVYKTREEAQVEEVDRKRLAKEEAATKKRLVMFCNHSFPDSVSDWLHLKMIRVFIEAILRYGPPPEDIVTTILKVWPNKGGFLNNQLTDMYRKLQEQEMQDGAEDDTSMTMGLELRPYVFIPVLANFD